MVRTGRPRKDPEKKVGHYEPQVAAVSGGAVVERIHVPEAPRMPDGTELLPGPLLLWSRFWESQLVRALDALEGVDRAIVDKWVLAENRLVVVEQTIDETGYLTSGSMDQVTLNPLWRARKDLQDEIRRYWEVLGLTPRDRARLGIDLIRQQSDAASWNERLSRISKGETQESDKVRRAFQGRRKP